MATYTFYDTDGVPLIPGVDNTNGPELLWGGIHKVRWFSIPQAFLNEPNNRNPVPNPLPNKLEITIRNLVPLSSMAINPPQPVWGDFTAGELFQRVNSQDIQSKVSMMLKVLQEGNNAIFKFKLSRATVEQLSNNLTTDLQFTPALINGKMCLFFKLPPNVGPVIFAFGVTLASGGVKIPR